jgi:hypothetical protein
LLHAGVVVEWPRALQGCSKPIGLMYLCGKAIHRTPPFQVDSRQPLP